MDYSIWKLRNYGLSESNIRSALNLVNCIFDFVILEKKDAILLKTSKKHTIMKILQSVSDKPEIFSENLALNPFILVGFDAPYFSLKKLLSEKNITTIKELESTDSKELNKNIKPSMKSAISKIKLSIAKLKETDYYIIQSRKISILSYIFMKKEVFAEEILNSKLFLEQNNNNLDKLKSILDELEKDGYIYLNNNKYFFPTNIYYQSRVDDIKKLSEKAAEYDKPIEIEYTKLDDFLKTDFKDKDLFILRLDGKTLEEIGNIYGVSRERIRQRQKKLLNKLPKIYELKKYKKIYEKYDFSKNEFTEIINRNSKIYELLGLYYKKGNEDVGEYILKSDRVPGSKKIKYLEKYKYFFTRFGEVKRITKQEFAEEVLYKYKGETFGSDEFLKLYNSEAMKYTYLNVSIEDVRALEAIISRSKFVIQSYGRTFRYYDMTTSLDDEILLELLKKLNDGWYSMKKIINDNPKVIRNLDIHDEYELHNLYRKRKDLLDSQIKLSRSPEFAVGNIEKLIFVQELLFEYANQPIDKLIKYLNKEFGLRENTMYSYLSSNFREYLDGQNIADTNANFEYDFASLKSMLLKPIYLKSEINSMLKMNNLHLNTLNLSDLGYYMTGNIIYKKEFGSPSNAFSKLIDESGIWKRGSSPIEVSREMSSYLYYLEQKLELVMISENTYARISFLENNGIGKSLLKDFISSVYEFSSNNTYFTLYSLEKQGFEHELINLGFEDLFYERLITTSEHFSIVNRSSPLLFTKQVNENVSLNNFIYSEIREFENGIDIYDLRDNILEKFNVDIDIYDLQIRAQQAGAYYSKQMEKIYTNKNEYLDEVYR